MSTDQSKLQTRNGSALEPRVARLEANLERITDEIDRFIQLSSKSSDNLRDDIQELGRTVSDKIATVAEKSRPNSANMAMWAGVLLTIVSIGGTLVYVLIQQKTGVIEKGVDLLQSASLVDAYRKGQYDERLDSHIEAFKDRSVHVDAEFGRLDERLQREMKGLISELKTYSDGNKHQMDEKVAALRSDFDKIETYGSPVTRERLTAMEERFKSLGGKP